MNCFKHKGNFPCHQCEIDEYNRCMQENNQNHGDPNYKPHDLTELRKKLNILFEEKYGTNEYHEMKDGGDLANKIKIQEKIRYGL